VKCPLRTHYFTVHEYRYMDLETEWINVVLFKVQQIGINNLETAEYSTVCFLVVNCNMCDRTEMFFTIDASCNKL
jgi:hypothetical protein